MAADDFVKNVTILIDANSENALSDHRYIPLISKLRFEVLVPRVVYSSSPQLRYSQKQMSQVLNGRFEIRIMNPWTPFELELM